MKNDFSDSDAPLRRRHFLQLSAMGALALAGADGNHPIFGAALSGEAVSAVSPVTLMASEKSYLVAPQVAPLVQSFSLAQIRLLDGPFKHAQDQDHAYLRVLEPDRFLHNVCTNAGLKAKAPIYAGWENSGVAGHTLGHYLSALSQMYLATGDAELKRRVDYLVDEMALCQDKNGDGYVSAIPDGRAMFNDVKAGHGDGTHRGWVPWYTQHKLFAGLRDAHLLIGNERAKTVFLRLAGWAIDTTQNLSDEQWDIMLTQEHGGMAESLADAYALTGEQKYLDCARKFSHRQILDPLSEERDTLDGFHANTQIPKVIGFRRIYELSGDSKFGRAARFFWDTVTQNRTYVTGGNSDHEHFFPPADTRNHLSTETAETCNVYNMLKLTRALWSQAPNGREMDWYERALFNQILGSQDPMGGDKGGFNYFNPLSSGLFKTYSSPETDFWCCVGTGIENHSKYGETIYYHDQNALWVNLFIASELSWAEKGLILTQKTNFPDEETASFTFHLAKLRKLALKIRHPSWAKNMTLAVNGKVHPTGDAGGYETIEREWKNGDVVSVRLPMGLRVEELHDAPEKQALLYGPIVLAADLGPTGLPSEYTGKTRPAGAPSPAPLFVCDDAVVSKVRRAHGPQLRFAAQMVGCDDGEAKTVPMLPYSRAHHMRYGVYFDVLTTEQWARKREEIAQQQKRERELEARTLDEYRSGEQQSEVDHALQGQNSNTGNFGDRKWRDASDGGFFEFQLKAPPTGIDGELQVTYWGNEVGNRTFDILVDGQKIATQSLHNDKPNQFWDVLYPLRADLLNGKERVTIRFVAQPGNTAGGIFGARMLK